MVLTITDGEERDMLYTELTCRAMCIAYEAHEGQRDQSGVPYIFHPMHVAERVGDDEYAICAALLHDVVRIPTGRWNGSQGCSRTPWCRPWRCSPAIRLCPMRLIWSRSGEIRWHEG